MLQAAQRSALGLLGKAWLALPAAEVPLHIAYKCAATVPLRLGVLCGMPGAAYSHRSRDASRRALSRAELADGSSGCDAGPRRQGFGAAALPHRPSRPQPLGVRTLNAPRARHHDCASALRGWSRPARSLSLPLLLLHSCSAVHSSLCKRLRAQASHACHMRCRCTHAIRVRGSCAHRACVPPQSAHLLCSAAPTRR